mgnify:CR=1 FL=1
MSLLKKRFFFTFFLMLMTTWKSALFRVSYETLSSGLSFSLNFRPTGIRFLHNPMPPGIVAFSRLPYLYRGTQRVYQVPLLVDSNGEAPFFTPMDIWVTARLECDTIFPIHSKLVIPQYTYRKSRRLQRFNFRLYFPLFP